MKHLINKFMAIVFLLFSVQASAGLVIADLGGVDEFLASRDLKNSGDASEEEWVESILGFNVTLDEKYDSSGSDWTLAGDAGNQDVYYLEMATEPSYFLLKLGTGGTSLDSHFLFRNQGDLNYAVVNFLTSGIDFSLENVGIDRMSHVGELDAINVPEPSAILLLGLGLLAVGFKRKA